MAVGMDLDLPLLLADLGRPLLGYLSDKPLRCDQVHLGGFDRFAAYAGRADVGLLLAAYEPYVKLAGASAARAMNARIVTIIAPGAKASPTAVIGAGSIVQHGTYIGEGVSLGQGVKVNVNASVHHGSTIGDFTTISPHCAILGECVIGRECLIGAGSTVRNNVGIGDRVYIGMGAAVVNDIPSDTLAYGVPAKPAGAFTPRKLVIPAG
ncbi:MAG: hypothetical protein SFV21_14515 [Rhodospirillaceae bacterium]|nr:hypothetical protein [Rhodospirillaceae bacterium]